jgi:ATP-binding cassette subfamily B protein
VGGGTHALPLGRGSYVTIAEAELFADLRRVANRMLWRPVLAFLKPYRGRLAVLLGLCALSTAFMLIQPFYFRAIIDAAIGQRAERAGIPFAPSGSLAVLTLMLLAVGCGNVLASLATVWYQSRLSHDLFVDVQSQLYDRVQRMPYGFFIHANPGAVVNRLENEASYASFTMTSVFNSAFAALLSLTAGVALLSVYDWRLVVILAFLGAFVVPSRWLRRRVQSHAVLQSQVAEKYLGIMHERLSVSGSLLTRLFGLQEHNLSAFSKQTHHFRKLGVRVAWLQGLGGSIVSIGTVLALAGVAWFGGTAVAAGTFTVGTLALLFFYVRILSTPIQDYGRIRFELTRALVAFGRVFEIRDFPAYMTFPTPTSTAEPLPGSLQFQNVSFAYPDPSLFAPASLRYADARPGTDAIDGPQLVLEDVTFSVRPGSFVALVGSSGSGKSTTAALAARLFDPTTGRVVAGGIDIREIPESQLVKTVGLVTQDTLLFHDTIRNNLLLARPDATDKELVRACAAAGIHQFLRSLPAGYGTMVGERGVRLSGGQRQRIAFARMVLRDPSIIILDEATAHLDAESESLLREAVESVLAGRTRVVIAHRLSTIVDADEVLVLEHGHIVERGTHGELLDAGGRYRQLYRTQLLSTEEAIDVTP